MNVVVVVVDQLEIGAFVGAAMRVKICACGNFFFSAAWVPKAPRSRRFPSLSSI